MRWFNECEECDSSVKLMFLFLFKKQKADLQKLQKVLTPDEYVTAVANMSVQEHLDVLEENYQATIGTYRRTLERIAAV